MAGCSSEDEELQCIISQDQDDPEADATRSTLVGSTAGFTVEDLIYVLKRISLSVINDEAKLATTIL